MNRSICQLWQIFTPKARRRFLAVLVLVLIMTAIESAGVMSIMPFLAVLGNPDVVTQQPQLVALYEWAGFETSVQFMVALCSASALVVVVSSFFNSVTIHSLNLFAHLQRHEISTRLLETYLRQPYAWFFEENSSELSKSMLSEVDQLGNDFLLPVIQIIAHGMVILAMLLLLNVYDPITAVVAAGIFGTLCLSICRVMSVCVERIRRKRRKSKEARFQPASEELGRRKAIVFSDKATIYLGSFRRPSSAFPNVWLSMAPFPRCPCFWWGRWAMLVW